MSPEEKRIAKAIRDAELARRAEAAKAAINGHGLRPIYNASPDRVRKFFDSGSWYAAAGELAKLGRHDDARYVRLNTPYHFEH